MSRPAGAASTIANTSARCLDMHRWQHGAGAAATIVPVLDAHPIALAKLRRAVPNLDAVVRPHLEIESGCRRASPLRNLRL